MPDTLEPEAVPDASLIPSISVEALIAARDRAILAFRKAADLRQEAVAALAPFGANVPSLCVEFGGNYYRKVDDGDYAEAIVNEVDRHIWLRLFTLTQIDTIMDSKTRKELFDRLHKTRAYAADQADALPPLTEDNVRETLRALHENSNEFFEKCVEESYRSLSWRHRTNEPGQLKTKLIVNGAFYSWSRSMQGDATTLGHHEALHDLERVLLILDGQAPATYQTGLRSLPSLKWGKWYDVPGTTGESLFKVKVFRVGTTHVRILKRELVDQMNRIMARRFPGAIPEPAEHRRQRATEEAQRPKPSTALTVKKARQAFYTPDGAAEMVADAAACSSWMKVLEPSAGSGQLVRAVYNQRGYGGEPKVTAIENDPDAIELLQLLAERVNARSGSPVMRVDGRDFFDVPVCAEYDRVVMNPPFSRAQEVEHVLRAWEFVKPGGKLVAIMSNAASGSARARVDGRYGALGRLFERYGAQITDMPAGSFKESGTNVRTVLVEMEKPK